MPETDTPTPARRRRGLWLVAGIVLAVAAAAAAVNFARGKYDDPVDSTTGGGASAVTENGGRTTIPVGYRGPGNWGLILDPAAHTLYVLDTVFEGRKAKGAVVSIVDLTANKVAGTIALPDLPRDIALDPGTRTLYAVTGEYDNPDAGAVIVVDVAARKITATIPTGQNAWKVAVDEKSHTAYILNCVRNCIDDPSADRPSTLSVLPSGATTVNPPIPFGDFATDFALDTDTNRAYIVNGHARVDVFDLATSAVAASIPLPLPNSYASEIRFDRATRTAFTSSWRWPELTLVDVDATTSRQLDRGGVNHEQYCTPYDFDNHALDGAAHTLYISCDGKGTVTAFDTETGAVTDTVQVADASSLAVDPNNHTLYVYGNGVVTVVPRGGAK
ncbi:YncE family protein [Nocardia huaxiensis]|uniref:YncE family protein n=1 Tax=Nocardia huaxiensis TaxID=2755382 RepID=A0A7D6ZF80_9NOCA|nr:YncE family protein [Nocardia huaxiensis]QLY32158.1 YncE family protein [Nocardia huaxiensis]